MSFSLKAVYPYDGQCATDFANLKKERERERKRLGGGGSENWEGGGRGRVNSVVQT